MASSGVSQKQAMDQALKAAEARVKQVKKENVGLERRLSETQAELEEVKEHVVELEEKIEVMVVEHKEEIIQVKEEVKKETHDGTKEMLEKEKQRLENEKNLAVTMFKADMEMQMMDKVAESVSTKIGAKEAEIERLKKIIDSKAQELWDKNQIIKVKDNTMARLQSTNNDLEKHKEKHKKFLLLWREEAHLKHLYKGVVKALVCKYFVYRVRQHKLLQSCLADFQALSTQVSIAQMLGKSSSPGVHMQSEMVSTMSRTKRLLKGKAYTANQKEARREIRKNLIKTFPSIHQLEDLQQSLRVAVADVQQSMRAQKILHDDYFNRNNELAAEKSQLQKQLDSLGKENEKLRADKLDLIERADDAEQQLKRLKIGRTNKRGKIIGGSSPGPRPSTVQRTASSSRKSASTGQVGSSSSGHVSFSSPATPAVPTNSSRHSRTQEAVNSATASEPKRSKFRSQGKSLRMPTSGCPKDSANGSSVEKIVEDEEKVQTVQEPIANLANEMLPIHISTSDTKEDIETSDLDESAGSEELSNSNLPQLSMTADRCSDVKKQLKLQHWFSRMEKRLASRAHSLNHPYSAEKPTKRWGGTESKSKFSSLAPFSLDSKSKRQIQPGNLTDRRHKQGKASHFVLIPSGDKQTELPRGNMVDCAEQLYFAHRLNKDRRTEVKDKIITPGRQ